MSLIARLGVVLGINSSEFTKGIDAADARTKKFKQNLKETQQTMETLKRAAAVTGLAMIAFGISSARSADQIADLADANDITTGKVLELRSALLSSGGDANKLGQFYASFTNAIDSAAQGNDKLRDSFISIGISTKDLGFLTQSDLQQKALAGLSKIDDVVRRNALAADLFGKAAKGVDFLTLEKNINIVTGSFDKQALAIKSAANSAQKIESLFQDIQIAALSALKPISDLVQKIPSENRIGSITKAFEILGLTIAIAFGTTAVGGVLKLATALRVMSAANPWLLGLGLAGTAMLGYGLFGFDDKTDDKKDDASQDDGVGSFLETRKIEQSSRDKVLAKSANEMKELEKASYEKRRLLNDIFVAEKNLLDLESEKYKLSTSAYEQEKLYLDIGQKRYEIEKEYRREQIEALKQFELANSDEYAQAKALYDLKILKMDELKKIESDYAHKIGQIRIENFEKEIARQKSWVAGWEFALKKYTEESEKASNRGAEAFNLVMSNMEKALSNFVQTGKLNFKDFVGDIVKQLIYLKLKAQATTLFGSLFSFAMKSFGGSGIPGMPGTKGMASGGAINSPSIVGENGAELFVPRTPGTIIPNGAWQAQMSGNSGMTINGNYIANMSAIDTQSGMQFLAKNRDTIWAAYQSANRSVPISR